VKESVKLVRTLRDLSGRQLGIGITVDVSMLAYEIVKSSGVEDIKSSVEQAASCIALSQLEPIEMEAAEFSEKLRNQGYPRMANEVERAGFVRKY
ncbi:MAG: hypothetical protein DRJ31_06990, partial [Candidatus Methanomethylicota archaeon]